jgi:hypothetical protein
LGNSSNPKVSFFDVPGFGDPTFNIEQIAKEIEKAFSSGQKINICLIVTKSTDYRLSFQEIIALKAIKTFLSDMKPDGFYCWISHCDVSKPDEAFIKGKIDSYNQFAKIAIPRQNVILFNNSAASLNDFVGRLRSTTLPSMSINLPMLQQNAKAIFSEIASLVSGVKQKNEDLDRKKKAEELERKQKAELEEEKKKQEQLKKEAAAAQERANQLAIQVA